MSALLRGHVASMRNDYPAQHAVRPDDVTYDARARIDRGTALCGRPVVLDKPRAAFNPDAGVTDPPCRRCTQLVDRRTCPRCGGTLRWVDDAYICAGSRGCGDEWAAETIDRDDQQGSDPAPTEEGPASMNPDRPTLTDLGNITVVLANVEEAADYLDGILNTGKLLTDPEGLGQALSCTEADAFAGLLRAVGLDRHAADLIGQHADHDTDDDDEDHIALAAVRAAEQEARHAAAVHEVAGIRLDVLNLLPADGSPITVGALATMLPNDDSIIAAALRGLAASGNAESGPDGWRRIT